MRTLRTTGMRAVRWSTSAAALVLVLAIGGCGKPTAGSAGADPASSASTKQTSTTPPSTTEAAPTTEQTPAAPTSTSEEPTTTDETPAAPSDAVETYVYYVVDTGLGLRLAREIRDVPGGSAAAAKAVQTMIAGALDPDYTTTWNPATAVQDVTAVGDMITVDLSADARTANVGSPGAAIMIQQLVWTVTDALTMPAARVQLTIDGAVAGELWGAVEWSEPVVREEPLGLRTLTQIDTPGEGASVSSPVTVSGDAAAFEATVPWRVVDASGAVVESGFTMTASGVEHGPYSFEVELPPGDYVVEVHQDDPSDGEGGTPYVDTRSITVVE